MAQVHDPSLLAPPEHLDAASRLSKVSNLEIMRTLAGGSPQTGIYVVSAESAPPLEIEGTWVLKVDATWRVRGEAENHPKVASSGLAPYVPLLGDLALAETDDSLSALLYGLATGSLLFSQTFERLLERRVQESVHIAILLTRALLDGWNSDCEKSVKNLADVCRGSLNLSPERIATLQDLFPTCSPVLSRRIEATQLDRWLINPLYYLAHLTGWFSANSAVPTGSVHGDLHPGNIIASELSDVARGSEPPLALIDFALAREGNVLFDLAYFEIAVLWHLLNHLQTPVDRAAWWNLELYLRSGLLPVGQFDAAGRANDASLVLTAIRKETFQHARGIRRLDEYWLSYLAASVEAGLTLALEPERIAKDVLLRPHLQALSFLTAASRLHRLLEQLGSVSDIQVRPGEQPGELRWPDSGPVQPAWEELQDVLDVATELAPALRSGRTVLILGDRFAKEILGVPEDGVLMRNVAERLGCAAPPAGGDPNVAAMDWLEASEEDKQRAAAESVLESPNAHGEAELLTLINWASVLDWSYSPESARIFRDVRGRALRRVFCDGSDQADLELPESLLLVHLRGTADESKRMALGLRGLTKQHAARGSVLRSLLQSLPFRPTLLFVGFEKTTFDLVRSEITDTCDADVWVFRDRLSDEDRMTLEKSRGYKTAQLSPQQFLLLCQAVGQQEVTEEDEQDSFVLDVADVERVEGEEGNVYFRRSDSPAPAQEVPLNKTDFRKIDRHLEVLHRATVLRDTSAEPGAFFRGYPPSWKELAQDLAIWRTDPGSELLEAISQDLAEHGPRRISLWYEPGAGATTLLRQVAFHLYFEDHAPTALLRRCTRDTYGEVVRFYNHFRRSFVLLADEQDVSRGEEDALFSRLQERGVPVVLVYAARSYQTRRQLRAAAGSRAEGRQRRFYLVDEIDGEEKRKLKEKISPYLSTEQKRRLARSSHTSLFLILLETLEMEFARLREVVDGMLGATAKDDLELLAAIAFVSYFGHLPTPSVILEAISGLSAQAIHARVEQHCDRLLLVEDKDKTTYWVPRHFLLARAVLARHLSIEELRGTALKEYAIGFIEKIGHLQNKAATDVVWALVGTDREQALREELKESVEGVRTLPSLLMRRVASQSGQDDIWQSVVKTFPHVPLFLAHYGRFLYGTQVKRFPDSERYLLEANELTSETNHTILHMLGMRFRAEFVDKLYERRGTGDAELRRDLSSRIDYLVEQATQYFEKAVELAPYEEHGYVSHLQMLCSLVNDAVAEAGREDGERRRGRLLSRDVQDWLGKAHRLVRRVEAEVPFSDRSEFFLRARARLVGLEGRLDQIIDYYRSALDRVSAESRPFIARALARNLARRAEEAHIRRDAVESWRRDYGEATQLMAGLLRADPYDAQGIEEWFRCARFDEQTSRRELIQRLEDLWEEDRTLQTAFYLHCLYFLEGLEFKSAADFQRSEVSRAESEARAGKSILRPIREWVGPDYALLPKRLIVRFRESGYDDSRPVFPGRIARVRSENDGLIALKGVGQEIWFQPHVPGSHYITSSEEGESVEVIIGFSYEKPRARLVSSEEPHRKIEITN